MQKLLLYLLSFLALSPALAQNTDEQLATEYMHSQEYDKAIVLFEKVYAKKPNNYIYANYLSCLLAVKDFKQGEKLIKRHIKQNPQWPKFRVDLGYLQTLAGETSKADKLFAQIISELLPDEQQIVSVANAFLERKLFAQAVNTYTKGEKIMQGQMVFNMQIADIYYRQGDLQKMMKEYLDLLDDGPSYASSVQMQLQTLLAENASEPLRVAMHEALLRKVQQSPDKTIFAEMLLWYAIQQGDLQTAMVQSKALDKRLKENGERLLSLANACIEQHQYDMAMQCYQYIIDKGTSGMNYMRARIEWVNVSYLMLTEKGRLSQEEMIQLEQQFESTLLEVGKNAESVGLIKKLAHVKAFYLLKPQEGIALLEDALKFRMPDLLKSECKLELGDILLFANDTWEASLTYSQVEKDFPDEPIGHLAKFKNAKLTFFAGEFMWAKAQLDVLRASTSKLIANDAMQLSLSIGDNITEDSSFDPLSLYALADLHSFRLKDDSALITLDLLEHLYPMHPLADEALYKKAEIYKRRGQWTIADSLLKQITAKYSADILADDALYERGLMQELTLKNIDLAKEIYFNLITDYPSSIYVVDARKRFRKLRGDNLN